MKLILLVARNTDWRAWNPGAPVFRILGGNAWSTVDVVGLYIEATLQWWGRLISVLVFVGNIVLRDLMGSNFRLIGIFGVFHAFYYSRFERVSLFEQLLDTLRIRALDVR